MPTTTSAPTQPAAAAATPPVPAIGASGTLTHTVVAADTAAAWGNELPVLATPVLLWLAEIACMRATDEALPAPWMTVGAHHDVTHEAPTLQGDLVRVSATLVEVDGKRLIYELHAEDSARRVLSGRHTRGLVDGDKFRARLTRRS